jgi:hypothetical protein
MTRLSKMRWIGSREVPTAGAFKEGGKAAGMRLLSTNGN